MNLLSNAQNCTLYDFSFRIIAKIKFVRETPTTLTLIFYEKPDASFPKDFRLVPEEGSPLGNKTFLCEMPPLEPYEIETTGMVYYVGRISMQEAPNTREDIRISVQLDVEAFFENSETPDEPEILSIKNLSAGGLMFTSRKKFPRESIFTFRFPVQKGMLSLKAQILSRRPVADDSLHAYGCHFIDIPTSTESALRNFVYSSELHKRNTRNWY